MTRRAVLCSRNPNKARELERLMPGWRIEPLDTDAYPPEEGATYYENALGKARFGRALASDDAWVLAEDSGIEVEGLGGRPGIESARFGGDDPVGRLLTALDGVEGPGRRARYVSELVAFTPTGAELHGTGVLTGRIAREPRGHEGFGYDPIFVPDRDVTPREEERTVAELGNEWKAQFSHRARAAQALLAAASAAR